MRFGHFCLPTYLAGRDIPQEAYMRRLVDFFACSEDLGFDAVWANEHHFHPYGGLLPSPPVMLAALAQRTSRVLLGTSVIVLPLHNPIEVAEQLAMVDLMSGGRPPQLCLRRRARFRVAGGGLSQHSRAAG
jgi:alkanesulfonate monooxygenase SsuD/methylene tetrahydromethanopterin reductase-like flavin-dependent oxidoreductase (luciferase family)